ncbi:MAG: AMP-binding protein [Mycobacteriales bacterium]|nr:AMP-binding protein [Mycobacteriales bacterium]
MTALGRRAADLLERFDDHDSLFFEGTWHRSHALAARARRAARGLVELGVRPGDRVVVCMANCPEVGLAYAALWRAGAVPTPVLFLLTEDELRHVVSDSGAVAAITTPEFLPKVQEAAQGLPVVVVGEGGTASWADLETADELPLVDRADDDLAALLYTGGTTGRSKGVALRHAGLDAAGAAAYDVAYREGRTTTLLPLPLAHAYGLMVSVAGLHAREPGRSVLQRWFDPVGFLDLVEKLEVHNAACIPAMLQALLAQPLEQRSLPTWDRVSSGGAPLAREVAEELERRVPGLEVREGYGCTETSALISTQPQDERRLGSVGKPVPGVEVRIDAPSGQDGEICVRGPLVMAGYWQDKDATDAAIRDGWFHTGDVGRLDEDGFLYVVDRIKDLVIRNGFNVYPRDVEDVLLAHPDVTAAAVVGVPDDRVGEEVVAVVSLAPGATVTAEDLIAFSKERISAAKYPRRIEVVDAVPLTSVFKTDRKAVRRLLG